MVRRLTAWEEANPVAYLRQQEQNTANYNQARTLIFDTVVLHARKLDASRQILKQDRSAAKQAISEPFGRWVAALDFYLKMCSDFQKIPKKYCDLYDEIYQILRPRTHWHQLGAARDPWLAAPGDSTYVGVHLLHLPSNHWAGRNRLILNSKEATPAFITGYNDVFDQLMRHPGVSGNIEGMQRLKVN